MICLIRIKIMQNIGVAFIKTGQYTDAISSFEHIMSTSPNLKAGFNLILCYFATGDREQMKKAFQKLIAVPLEIDDDDKYISSGVSISKAICTVCKTKKFELFLFKILFGCQVCCDHKRGKRIMCLPEIIGGRVG